MPNCRNAAKRTRRWPRIASRVFAIALLLAVVLAWQNHRWIDPRFVGTWHVTDSKSEHESIYVLESNGSARWFQREGESGGAEDEEVRERVWSVKSGGPAPYYWPVGRDGFLLQNRDKPTAQLKGWLVSLGGLMNKGQITSPRVNNDSPIGIESVSRDRIRLSHAHPDIIEPLTLTLNRIDPEEVPAAQR